MNVLSNKIFELIFWSGVMAQFVFVLSQSNGTSSGMNIANNTHELNNTNSRRNKNSIKIPASRDKSGAWEDKCESAGSSDTLCKKYTCLSGDAEIRRRQLCDGVFDCPDFSDECLCNIRSIENMKTADLCDQLLYQKYNECCIGYFQCQFHDRKICVPGSHICDGIVHCTDGLDEAFCYSHANVESVTHGMITPTQLSLVDVAVPDNYSIFRRCTSTEQNTYIAGRRSAFGDVKGVFVDWRRVYDNVADCEGGVDEWIPTYLYCFNNWQSFHIDEDLGCYGNETVTSGGNTYTGKGLGDKCDHHVPRVSSSSVHMYSLRGYPIFWGIFGFTAVIINTVVIVHQLSYYCKCIRFGDGGKVPLWSKSANRVLVINLSLLYSWSGMLMISKTIADYVTMGRHWRFSDEWKNEAACIFSVFFFTAVTGVTVLIYAFLTGVRLFTVLYPFKSVKMVYIYTILAICWVFPLAITITLIPKSFRVLVETPNLPQVDAIVLEKDQVREIVRRSDILYSIFNASSLVQNKQLNTMGISAMMDILKGYAPTFVREWGNIGQYSSYALCLPQVITKFGEPGWEIVFMLTVIDTIIYFFISVAYAFMFTKLTNRRFCIWKPTNNTSVNRRSRETHAAGPRAKDDKSMHRRIFWMIFINMITWLPICITNLIFNYTKAPVRTAFTKEFLVTLMQAQALFSPFFYSRLLRHAFHEAIRPFKSLYTVCKAAIFK